jgi:TPR repeat protein
VTAQYMLGYFYNNGIGAKQNYKEAIKWYKLAAEQDSATAQKKLGVCYADGKGVKQNYKEALRWFQLAAEHGDEDAKKILSKMNHG